ncbi:uncharacterized protein EURHEDRAFT_410951 [Aspergillus ruber CBS 135680]|uniref:Protamine P1 n=1 Tax=Aspergillus ruber (strain CBS 135680) TaxID=1388766 RepID=A0A017SHI6_ASPRC|nr:uncharacterized protein EURHEDRAFT_410951 [Aspergillus ruber CBS 135680]EYE96427.1 hypothetical protein EURHEDRAFT_410951 [Aspergillus ruber CBS 135680]
MPFPRPTSPVSLEVCSPSADDIVSDDVLGSDDELGEDARNAQRQRIEKLAEAYLQGGPLFILSASLKGPFDQGWVNPWTKKRKSHSAAENSSDPVVQETDPRPRKQLHHESHESSCRTETSVAPSDAANESLLVTSKHQKSRKPLQDKQSRNSASVQGTPKRTVPWTGEAQLYSELRNNSIARPTDVNWLKRDRRGIGFGNFDPPTSPTTTVSTRLSDTRSRRHQSLAPGPRHSSPEKTDTREPASSQVDRPQESRRSESIAESHFRPSPIRQQNVPHSATHNAQSNTSFCIVSSSSQLPKFEFRRRRKRSKSPTMKQAGEEPSAPTETDKNAQQLHRQEYQQAHKRQLTSSKESTNESAKREIAYNEPSRRTFTSTAGSRALDSHTASRGLLESRSTHGNIENIPSAQPIPPNPAMADYAPSLHYTAPPTSASENDDDTGPVPLSTQAALLHAQKSFQDGLESQVEDQPTTSPQKRRSSRSSLPSSTTSQKITPFHRLNTTHLAPDNSTLKTAAAVVPSTQCIVDAVTPFTFSTERKRHRHVHIESLSRVTSTNKKQKASSFSDRSPSPHSDWSPSPERDRYGRRIQSAGESPRSSQPGIDSNYNNHEPSQSTALPLTLSGTTPPTGQDGQGGLASESFNLSQAIADAGSWLQESFDWNRDLRRSGNNHGASSGDAQRSALNLDTH